MHQYPRGASNSLYVIGDEIVSNGGSIPFWCTKLTGGLSGERFGLLTRCVLKIDTTVGSSPTQSAKSI